MMSRSKSTDILTGLIILYCFFIMTQFPTFHRLLEKNRPPSRFLDETPKLPNNITKQIVISKFILLNRGNDNSSIYKSAMHAWTQGRNLWARVEKPKTELSPRNGNKNPFQKQTFRCPDTISIPKAKKFNGELRLPCGMKLGSHVTIVGQSRLAHSENKPSKTETKEKEKEKAIMVSQFMVELRRERDAGTRLMHFNPRIRGDWTEKPVIEMNHCYRGQWGNAVRCQGLRSRFSEDTVDGKVRCEKWMRDDISDSFNKSRASVLLGRLMGRRKKVGMEWPFPFLEAKSFVLTIVTGFEGYHITVNGRHLTSFAYRNGYDLEDGMTLNVFGDVDVHSVFVGSLPTSLPSLASKRHLEMSTEWKARPLPDKPIVLFIGAISAADHFAERMAVRKSWMQHSLIKSSKVVARFFVALHEREAINVELKKEAEFFGDIIIVPYLDHYDLVVLKTLAICEFGVNMVSTKYIMKCDDDTFVRIDAVIQEASQVKDGKSLYIGKINFYHEPLREGKWGVTRQEWPSDVYPPYADGPGYVVSTDIARFIMSGFQKTKLKLFKMEDVSVGVWVEQFNKTRPVDYLHNEHFHQSGCVDDYITAHYQSPKQLVCLWEKLQSEGKPKCCNLR